MRLDVTVVTLGVPCLDLGDERALIRDTVCKTLTTQVAELSLGHVEPTAVFWGRVDVEFLCDALRLRRSKGFIKRCLAMGMQILKHETDLLSMGIMLIHKCLYKVGPINFGTLRCYLGSRK